MWMIPLPGFFPTTAAAASERARDSRISEGGISMKQGNTLSGKFPQELVQRRFRPCPGGTADPAEKTREVKPHE